MKYLGFIVLLIVVAFGTYLAAQKSTQLSEGDSVVASVSDAVDLHGQGLTRVPEDIFTRNDITSLDLSDNNLEGALPAEIRVLQKLKMLDLSGNNFTGVPAEIGQLKDLEILDLSHNQITGLPLELGDLQNLQLLDLTGNQFSEADLARIREKLPSSTVIKTQ